MNEDKVLKKLRDHDKRFDSHDKRFDSHDKRFDKIENILKNHDERFIQVENKLDKHQVILENLVAKALEHDDKFVKIEEKIQASQDRILSAIDGVVKKNSDIDIEQLSTRVTLDRHQDEINANKKDIIKIKKVVKIA